MSSDQVDDEAVKSADRVLALVELLGLTGREMSHAEIAATMGIPKSSLSKLLKNLLNRGWFEFDPVRRTYRLGPKLGELARSGSPGINLVKAVAPLLSALTRSTRETTALNVRRGDEAEVVATVLSPMRLLSTMRLGDRAPLYATSGGKVILAHQTDAFLERYLGGLTFQRFTEGTIASVGALRAELDQVRATGVARAISEYTFGVVGIACAVVSPDGECVGAVNVAMPMLRHTPDTDAMMVDRIRDCIAMLGQRVWGETAAIAV